MRTPTLLLVLVAACGETQSATPDAHPPIDSGVTPDAPDATPSPPGSVAVTAGGGVTASAGHRLSVRIGAPQPLGTTESSGHTLTTGPGAIPWSAP